MVNICKGICLVTKKDDCTYLYVLQLSDFRQLPQILKAGLKLSFFQHQRPGIRRDYHQLIKSWKQHYIMWYSSERQIQFRYESFSDVGESWVWWRADFQSGSRVLKKVSWTFSYLYLCHTMWFHAKKLLILKIAKYAM